MPLTGPIKRTGRKPNSGLVGYRGAHVRVERSRGKARIYFCVDCNEQAQEWSLSNNAVNVFVSSVPNSAGKEYSLNVEDYEPRCIKCHRAHDETQFSPQARAARHAAVGENE